MIRTPRPRLSPVLGVAVATAVVIAGCGGGEQPGVDLAAADVVFVATDFAYDPDTTTIDAGPATIALDNQGSVVHDWMIEGQEATTEVEAGPGGQAVETVDLQPGIYAFYCDISGHRASGMEGTLTVEEP